jgi:hypothetical protein
MAGAGKAELFRKSSGEAAQANELLIRFGPTTNGCFTDLLSSIIRKVMLSFVWPVGLQPFSLCGIGQKFYS